MFGFLKRGREQAKKEGRAEAFGELGDIIGQMFLNEMTEYMEQTARPSLVRCVEVFKLRTEQNIFVDPDPDLKPQQILKKEWDFTQEVLVLVAKKVKDELNERTSAMIEAFGPVDYESSAMLRAKYNAQLLVMLNEIEEAVKAHLAAVLDKIHARNDASPTR